MEIPIADIKAAAARRKINARTISEARLKGLKTAFISHSHKDRDLIAGLETLMNESGWNIYIDWLDTEMPEKPDESTARRIKLKISESDIFLFYATENSMASRWCPWEIGYADGTKPNQKILVVKTSKDGSVYGNEYLGLYRRAGYSEIKKVRVWRAASPGNHEVLSESI